MKAFRRILALLLAAAALALTGGCDGGESPLPPDGPQQPDGADPDYAAMLTDALGVTERDLTARFQASRAYALAQAAEYSHLTADFTLDWPDKQGERGGSVTGMLLYDKRDGTAQIDASVPEGELNFSFTYSPEFVGLSCPDVFGESGYFGLEPKNFREQLDGSALAELMEIDLDTLSLLDGILDATPPDVHVYRETWTETVMRLARSLAATLDFSAEDATITRGDKTYTGANLRGAVDAQTLAKCLEDLSVHSPAPELKSAAEAVRQAGRGADVTFTVADGKLWHVSGEYEDGGSTVYLEAEFYGDDGTLVSVAVEPYFHFELILSDDISLTWDGQTKTLLTWDEDGAFSFITHRNDVTDLALEGTLTAAEDAIAYQGIWYSGERGDRNALQITLREGGQVTVPQERRSLADVPETELYLMITGVVARLGA